MTRGLFTPLTFLVPALAGCAHPSPLVDRSAPAALDRIDLVAQGVESRLLPRVEIDLRDGLSIAEATTIAVIANPELRAVRSQRGLASAQALQAGILRNPELVVGIDAPAFGAISGTRNAVHLGVSWEITALIARDAYVHASEAHVREVDLDVAWQEWRTAIEARLQWRRLAASDRELAAAKASEDDLRTIADTLERAASSHDATTVEASSARSALDEAVLARSTLERERDRAKRALARVLGLRADASITLQTSASIGDQVADRDALAGGLADHRLDLLAFTLGYASQEERLRAAVLARIPRITLDVGIARDPSDVGTAGASLAIALPVFDRAQGRIAIESATRDELREEYAARVFGAHSELDDAFAELAFARGALASAEGTLPHLEQLVATYRTALSQHLVDVPSVYVAVNALNARRLDVLHRRQEIGDLVTKIELASGQLAPNIPAGSRSTP